MPVNRHFFMINHQCVSLYRYLSYVANKALIPHSQCSLLIFAFIKNYKLVVTVAFSRTHAWSLESSFVCFLRSVGVVILCYIMWESHVLYLICHPSQCIVHIQLHADWPPTAHRTITSKQIWIHQQDHQLKWQPVTVVNRWKVSIYFRSGKVTLISFVQQPLC